MCYTFVNTILLRLFDSWKGWKVEIFEVLTEETMKESSGCNCLSLYIHCLSSGQKNVTSLELVPSSVVLSYRNHTISCFHLQWSCPTKTMLSFCLIILRYVNHLPPAFQLYRSNPILCFQRNYSMYRNQAINFSAFIILSYRNHLIIFFKLS